MRRASRDAARPSRGQHSGQIRVLAPFRLTSLLGSARLIFSGRRRRSISRVATKGRNFPRPTFSVHVWRRKFPVPYPLSPSTAGAWATVIC
jgi:hypothetical protein